MTKSDINKLVTVKKEVEVFCLTISGAHRKIAQLKGLRYQHIGNIFVDKDGNPVTVTQFRELSRKKFNKKVVRQGRKFKEVE